MYREPSCIYSSMKIFERSGEIVLWGRLYNNSAPALWTCIGYHRKSDISIFNLSFENIKLFARAESHALSITYVRNGFVYGTPVDRLPHSSSIITTLGRLKTASAICTTVVVRDVGSLPYYRWLNFYERCSKSNTIFLLRFFVPCAEVIRNSTNTRMMSKTTLDQTRENFVHI